MRIVSCLFLAAMCASFSAQADIVVRWLNDNDPIFRGRERVQLGETKLTNSPDADFVRVRECGITHVKLKVRGDHADVDYLAVKYGNGDWDRLQIREKFRKGTESRWIDLLGGARCVSAIAIVGQSGFRPGQTKIKFVGMKAGGARWIEDNDSVISFHRRVELGDTNLTNRPDADFVSVRECGITHVKMQISGDNADIDYLAVKYGNGDWDRLPIRELFRAGSSTRWIDLEGGERCVTALAIVGQSGFRPRQTHIKFIGLKPGAAVWIDDDHHSIREHHRVELGETFLSNSPDADSLNVSECGITHVKMNVTGDNAAIDYIAVKYGNGDWDRLPVRETFRVGTSSRWMDLEGGARCLKKIAIIGQSGFRPRQSKVKFIGLKR